MCYGSGITAAYVHQTPVDPFKKPFPPFEVGKAGKNLSLMCYVTVAQPSGPIIDFLQLRGLEYLEDYDPIRAPDATMPHGTA